MTLSSYLEQFRTNPTPLSHRQRILLWIAGIVAALSRFYAISKSLWEWDEVLFCLGVRHYDVALHHPHPPGYPLFIAAAKVLRPLAGSDFRALQTVTVIGAIALFSVAFALGRELRLAFSTALLGSLLFVFFPDVWFYGGTAFSDVPGTALVMAACALLLRGCRSRGSYVVGAFVLALSIGFRPQNFFIAAAPALLATWFRARDRRRDVFAAALIAAAVIAAAYGGAAVESESATQFAKAMRLQQQYLVRVDSYHNPARTPLRELAWDFFITPMRGGRAAVATAFMAIAGLFIALALRRWSALMLVLLFLPFNVFAWLMLDAATVTRYAVAYVIMHAFLAADFMTAVCGAIDPHVRGFGRTIEAVVLLSATLYCILWLIPALREVRRTPSPPVQVMKWVTTHVPRGSTIVLEPALSPFASYYLGDYHIVQTSTHDVMPPGPPMPFEYYVSDGSTTDAAAQRFIRPRGHLWQVARQRYFETFVRPVVERTVFVSGWHDLEQNAAGSAWRWTAARGELKLGPIPTRRAELSLSVYVPLDALPRPPMISIELNGMKVGQFAASTSNVEKTYVVPALADAPNRIVLSTDEVVNPKKQGLSADPRDLGLQLRLIGWRPLPALR